MTRGPLYLTGAILCEVTGTCMLKLSEGFTIPLPAILMVVAFACSFFFMTLTLKELPLGLVYGIWGGVGTILTTILGVLIWKDPINIIMGIGILVILFGVCLLSSGTQDLMGQDTDERDIHTMESQRKHRPDGCDID
jgi:multidrug transporter EmrE-like cation transporter